MHVVCVWVCQSPQRPEASDPPDLGLQVVGCEPPMGTETKLKPCPLAVPASNRQAVSPSLSPAFMSYGH